MQIVEMLSGSSGSLGGSFALAAARALVENSELPARAIAEKSLRIAGQICIYTNDQITIEELHG